MKIFLSPASAVLSKTAPKTVNNDAFSARRLVQGMSDTARDATPNDQSPLATEIARFELGLLIGRKVKALEMDLAEEVRRLRLASDTVATAWQPEGFAVKLFASMLMDKKTLELLAGKDVSLKVELEELKYRLKGILR